MSFTSGLSTSESASTPIHRSSSDIRTEAFPCIRNRSRADCTAPSAKTPYSARNFSLPRYSLRPSISAQIPLPAVILKLFASDNIIPFPLAYSTIAFPNGCSLFDSDEAARNKSSSRLTSVSKARISLTSSRPYVKVPVLSNAMVSTFPIFSRASPDLMITPCFAACPIAAITAVGVASTRAQGQNTTKTVTAVTILPVPMYAPIAIKRATGTR